MSIPKSDVWIIVAALNEAARIENCVRTLKSFGWNVVVVDDGSTDGTAEKARQAGAVCLRHLINRGQGASLQTGIDFALAKKGKWLVTFDADGQHRASDVPAMLEPLRQGIADVVLGSRFLGSTVGMPVHRFFLLKAAVWFTRITTRLAVTDTHNGLRALNARAANVIRIREDRMAHASEILHCIASERLRFVEHPVTIEYSSHSLCKGQRSRDAWGVLARLVISRIFA